MKRYETPMVELTKFDVEDVITASVNNATIVGDQDAIDAAITDIKGDTAGADFKDVLSW